MLKAFFTIKLLKELDFNQAFLSALLGLGGFSWRFVGGELF